MVEKITQNKARSVFIQKAVLRTDPTARKDPRRVPDIFAPWCWYGFSTNVEILIIIDTKTLTAITVRGLPEVMRLPMKSKTGMTIHRDKIYPGICLKSLVPLVPFLQQP